MGCSIPLWLCVKLYSKNHDGPIFNCKQTFNTKTDKNKIHVYCVRQVHKT
jgi:hypothetical protein